MQTLSLREVNLDIQDTPALVLGQGLYLASEQ